MEDRCKKVIKRMLVWFIPAFVLYLLFELGIGVPCPIKLVTGLSCPSCGITRMSVHMIHGEVRQAFFYNQMMPFVLPVLAGMGCVVGIRYIKTGREELYPVEHAILIALIVLLVLYGIVRNLPFYYWKI